MVSLFDLLNHLVAGVRAEKRFYVRRTKPR